jgi:hypothetical protein
VLNPGGDIDGLATLPLRGNLLKGLVRTVAVIVPGVLGQNPAEIPLTVYRSNIELRGLSCGYAAW